VVVSLRGTGSGTLTLEYIVPGARWAPTYVARLSDGAASLELRAVIAQETGEDWRGVKLALSTAGALSWTELPELPSLRIGRRQPPAPRAGWKPPPTGAELLYADRDRGLVMVAPPPPPPVPKAEPQPVAADEPVSRQAPEMMKSMMYMPQSAPRKGGGIGAAIGGIIMAPAALAAAGAGALRQRLSAPAANRVEEVEETEIAPGDLLAYDDLRMPPASSAKRGRLVPAERRELYLSFLVTQQVTLQFDVLAAIGAAEQRAEYAAHRAPPAGTVADWNDAYDFAFRADGEVEVPSDGVWHGIALATRSAPVALHHVVVPRETCDVFRLARLDNPHDAPLLPGPIDIYDGKDFVLTSQVAFTPPRGALELGLGVDPRVKAARRTRFREETTGMLRGSLRLEHEVEIDVENLTGRAAEVEVRERVPVRAVDDDDDVTVEVDRVAPAWEAWAPEPESAGEPRLRGGHRWQVALAAGEKQTLALQYSVKIASKHELVGGNRRES
jgi:hypothetical protein